MYSHRDLRAWLQLGAHDIDRVIRIDLVVVLRAGKGQGQQPLLFQVGLVDTGKAAGDDGQAAEMAGLEGGVLSRGALAVVPVANNDPLDAFLLVVAGGGGYCVEVARWRRS